MRAEFQTYVVTDEARPKLRDIGDMFGALLTELEAQGVSGRDLAIVKTHLEDACFYARRSVAARPENHVEVL